VITLTSKHHPELIFNTSFSPDGARLATASKDRMLRVVDPRTSSPVVSAVAAHQGTKGMRAEWCTGEVITTVGFGTMAQREFKLWDARLLASTRGPLQTTKIDNSGGLLFPHYDAGTGMLYLCGKGDASIRYYELQGDDIHGHGHGTGSGGEVKAKYDGMFQGSAEPTAGMAVLPKRLVDVSGVEVARMLRLTKDTVEPISFSLPRADKIKTYFQDDIYPPAPSGEPAHSAADWLSGSNAPIVTRSLQPSGMLLLSEKPPDEVKVSPAQRIRMQINAQEQEEQQRAASFSRMQALAVQRSQYHPNQSMGAKKGVDMERVDDSDDSDDTPVVFIKVYVVKYIHAHSSAFKQCKVL